MKKIARIETDFPEKFGIPRQSGLVSSLTGKLVFEKEYRNPEAFRGLEEYSHLWIIWEFSDLSDKEWSPTVRPPRLGGNKRVGVFATRSPNRPNHIGLSCVKIDKITDEPSYGTVIYVSGVDMLDGTAVYDIKPYLPYVDAHPEAVGGFSERVREYSLDVSYAAGVTNKLPPETLETLREILSSDPRPQYHNDPNRVYGMKFSGCEIKFKADRERVYVIEIEKEKE